MKIICLEGKEPFGMDIKMVIKLHCIFSNVFYCYEHYF